MTWNGATWNGTREASLQHGPRHVRSLIARQSGGAAWWCLVLAAVAGLAAAPWAMAQPGGPSGRTPAPLPPLPPGRAARLFAPASALTAQRSEEMGGAGNQAGPDRGRGEGAR